MADIDFTKIDSILSGVLDLLTIPKPKDPPVSPYLVLASKNRGGMSAQKIAANIIRRRAEAGLPVGNFPDGQVNPDEIMIYIIVEEVLEAISVDARTTVAISPGISIIAQGTTATGVPVLINGITTSIGNGNAIIQ